MNLNKAMIIGNLTRDPELRTTPNGTSVVSFGVATNFIWTDASGNKATQVTRTVNVVDTTPPVIDLSLLTDTLWPPNHKMVMVAEISATDICDEAPLLIVDVTSNEPISGPGDVTTDADWLWDNETGDLYLRAARSGGGDGRTYAITVWAIDGSGNVATNTADVTVPHDKGQGNGKSKGKKK